MTMTKEICLPKLGESILEATVVQWIKKVGDSVKEDEALLEVSTDKVNSEIPSSVSGVIKEILAQEGVTVSVGDPLVVIEVVGREEATVFADAPEQITPVDTTSRRDFFSPAVLRLAREKGIDYSALESIQGSGEGGRITKKDIENYGQAPKAPLADDIKRVPMSPLRKAVAENMTKSFYTAPHATLIVDVDVTDVKEKIKSMRNSMEAKLTITAVVAQAIANAARQFPHVNANVEGDDLLVHERVHLGIAVNYQDAVMVPVIKRCDQLDLDEIAQAVQNLAAKTRGETLTPDDATGGTMTLTNFGMSGISMGFPIIRYPEVAIVGIGAIEKKAVVIEEQVAVREVMKLSLTFDHRAFDGMYGCAYLAEVKRQIESFR